MQIKIRNLIRHFPLVIIFLLGLTPIIWFLGKGDTLLNGVDTNFPLNPLVWFTRRFYVWNNVLNGGADFSSSTAGAFFHFIQTVPYLLGFKLQAVELISLLFWFLLIVFSSYFLARVILPKRFLPQLLFTLFYSFNVYLFNTWENVKVANLALTAGIPLALGILILLDKGKVTRKSGFFLSAVAGIVLSGTGINPSYFFSFFLVLFFYFLVSFIASPKERIKKLTNFLLVLCSIIIVNVCWLFPTLNYVIKGVSVGGSIDKLGFTNWIDSLSENTSLFNVFRLQGAWDWYSVDEVTGLPLYIPYALNYFNRLPFIIFSLIIPVLAMLSLVFRKKSNSYLYLGFALMLLVGVFLGVGTHPPTGAAFRFLLEYIPFFSLFRSPWYIFAPLVTLAYAGLIGLLFDFIYEVLEIKKQKIGKIFLGFFGIILIAGNLLYCYPLVTGKIFRPGRSDGFYVSFPEYTFNAAKWLKEDGDNKRIISYPDDEIENFKWGYRGIESILHLFTNREVIFSSLNAPDSAVSRIIKEFYWRLKRQELDSALKIAGKLNASLIFEKKDQGSLSPAIPEGISRNFEFKQFGEWGFYRLPGQSVLPKLYSAAGLVYSYPYNKGTITLSLLDKDAQVINPDDSVVNKINNISLFTGKAVVAENLQMKDFQRYINSPSELSKHLISRDFSQGVFEFDIPEDGLYQPSLERYRLEDFGINPEKDLKVLFDGQSMILEAEKTSDSYVFFKAVALKGGHHKFIFPLNNKNLIMGGDFEKEEMFKKGGYGEGKVEYEIKEGEDGKFLSITNYGKAEPSADFIVSDFDPYLPYYVEVRYKQVYGNNGVFIPEQNTVTTLVKAQKERLPNYPEWGTFGTYYDPVKTESEMKVFLIAPFTTDPLGTKIFYDDLIVRKVFVNNLVFIKKGKNLLPTPEVSFKKSSPVLYQGTVTKVIGPHVIVFSENYSSDWKIKVFNEVGNAINVEPKHFSINLYANGWFLEKMPETYTFRIYYKPQILFNFGFGISCLLLLAGLVYFFQSRNHQ